ncbi:DUF1716-domain-containing protein [Rickenella mellea]|uniref:DUF1716-domain-containing protein n=1 Tax=Rickenella mellea TaxID=50990 RepID=A0A4R5XF19_9AGAM|nr:DUF1716-domain-containing protein [Rickenella mellea]
MDIDKLFKVPKLPTGGNKRRMPDAPTPEMLKRFKPEAELSANKAPPPSDGGSSAKGKSRAATVRDEEEEEEESSRDFAPGNDADYFAEEDDEGRFFGGGLTGEQKTIMNIFDSAVGEGVQEDLEDLTITGIRRILLRFERAVNKNQDQRSKYPDDPTKFIDSEADLDSSTKAMFPLAQKPVLAYPEIVKSGTLAMLVGLLSHENVDIVIDAVEVIDEFTDEEVGNEGEDDDGQDEEARDAALKTLIAGLLDQSILELLVDNLPRFNETEELDRQGVFHILGIFENILGFNPQLATRLISQTAILKWLLQRIEAKTHDENRGYASEILAILLQDNRENRLALCKANGVENMLTVLSQYRRRDPKDADEAEFMENVFDALCSALGEPEAKRLFLDAEGVDLMVLMMKEKKESASRSIKVLDYSMSGPAGTKSCETFVEALGLKTLFTALMGKPSKKQKGTSASPASEDTAHVLGILSSLFTNLASESPARIRLLAKFVENNYEKVDKLLEIREQAQSRIRVVEAEIEAEKKALLDEGEEIGEAETDRWYLSRLDGGQFTLQTVDYILAWVCMEDDGIRDHLVQMLTRKGKSLKDVVEVLKSFRDNIGDETETAESSDDVSPPQREILSGLINFLEKC